MVDFELFRREIHAVEIRGLNSGLAESAPILVILSLTIFLDGQTTPDFRENRWALTRLRSASNKLRFVFVEHPWREIREIEPQVLHVSKSGHAWLTIFGEIKSENQLKIDFKPSKSMLGQSSDVIVLCHFAAQMCRI